MRGWAPVSVDRRVGRRTEVELAKEGVKKSRLSTGVGLGRTDTDDSEPLVAEDRVLRLVASRPIGPTMSELLGEGDGSSSEGRVEVAVPGEAGEDSAHFELLYHVFFASKTQGLGALRSVRMPRKKGVKGWRLTRLGGGEGR